jgi:hypothetical protein
LSGLVVQIIQMAEILEFNLTALLFLVQLGMVAALAETQTL